MADVWPDSQDLQIVSIVPRALGLDLRRGRKEADIFSTDSVADTALGTGGQRTRAQMGSGFKSRFCHLLAVSCWPST